MGTRALVVSRNVALPMRLEREDIDVEHARPDTNWLARADDVDAVVLDVGQPGVAQEVLMRLRAEKVGIPVLVLGTDEDDWAQLADGYDGVALAPLPISAPGIAAALAFLVAQHGRRNEQPAAMVIDLRAPDSDPMPDSEAQPDAGPESSAWPPPPVPPPVPPAATQHGSATWGQVAANVATNTAPAPPPNTTLAPMPTPNTPTVAPEPPARRQAVPSAQRVAADAQTNDRLWAALQAAAGIVPLTDVADAIVVEAVDATGASSAALLVRSDVSLWRVEAGIGLRPAEERVELSTDSWLVARTIGQQLAVIVDDSDAIRGRLAGLPLSSQRYWACVPLGKDRGILILASETTAFPPSLIPRLAAMGEEAAPLLEQAMLLRHVARALAPYA